MVLEQPQKQGMLTFVGFLINQETKMKNKGGWCSPLLGCSDQNSAPCFGEPETRSWIQKEKEDYSDDDKNPDER